MAIRLHPVDSRQSFPALEERVLERWRERGTFQRQLELRAGGPPWTFYEGPPTANGRPGSHHVLSRVFKDIYPRYRAMRGFDVPRKAGWDCHGLPVELEVEKEIGVSSKEEIEAFGIAEFNRLCRESVFRYVEDWRRLSERIGMWIDLDDPYVTLDDTYIESVWWSLRELWDRDLLYEGHKVVPYCPRCGTALSSHEVALGYRDVVDPSVYVTLPVREGPAVDSGEVEPGDRLVVWTTTPWTLISHAATAVNPDVEYVRARQAGAGETYVVARALRDRVLGEGAETLATLGGRALAGLHYEPPFDYIPTGEYGPKGHTVQPAGFVTTEDGTGLVHTAIAFGEDDFRFGAEHGIALQNPVRADGTYDERVGDFEGVFVKDADARIVEMLAGRGRLLRSESYEHAYPHCWRCETPLLYYAKASWYVRTSERREQMLAANRQIDWHPEHIREGRFGKWLAGNVDWALSRDRYWGTPLPIWECDESGCGERTCVGSIGELCELGGEVPDDLHRPHIDTVEWPCRAKGCAGRMRRVSAVIDTWYDSGAMPFAQYHYPFENAELFAERFPADFICEAIDQTRGWFYTLHAEATLLFDGPAYRACVCLGHILDPEGTKMSKSRGNVVDPWEVIERHGADAFRWYYLTAQQPWSGYRFSVDTVGESVRQFLLTLWNTYAFCVLYANASGGAPEPGEAPAPAERGDLDRWALSRLQAASAEVATALDGFDSVGAGRTIAAYVEDLSNWYVRLSRRRFWEGDPAAVATLRECLIEVATLLAPFTPFVADAVYENLRGGQAAEFGSEPDSVHLRDFPEPDPTARDAELERGMAAVREVVELGRAARAKAQIKVRQPLRRAVVVASEAERGAIEALRSLVLSELNVHELDFVSEESELVRYEVKPNYRALGPRFGKDMPQVAAAIAALDSDAVAEALKGGREVGISIEGADHTLGAQDVQLAMAPLEGYEVSSEEGRAVALQTELDDELRREGLAREVVHAVQNARKEAGLEITDRIELRLSGDEELLAAAREHEAYVTGETLATSVALGADGADGGDPVRIEGMELRVAVARSAS